jgi:hypothetical protein
LGILRETAGIAAVLIKRADNRRDEDSVALQPRVHIAHSIHVKPRFPEKRLNVFRTLLYDGVLLRNIEIANRGAFAVPGDTWKGKNRATLSENFQQIAGTVRVVPQKHYARDCHRLYQIWKDGIDLLAAHSHQAQICGKI